MKPEDFLQRYNFKLDEFQRVALNAVDQGQSVLVSAPTGAGKTLIAEYVMARCLSRGQSVVYTAPIKALSNQKFREFQLQFPDEVGIVTGDVSINPDARLIIMTTEIYRNRILEKRGGFDRYSWIIYDEIHYLDDPERGTVWEESLIFKPPHMRLLGLSATIPNIREMAAWMEEIFGQPVKVVCEDQRPVPLHLYFQVRGEISDSMGRLRRQVRGGSGKSRRGYPVRHGGENRPESLLVHLQETNRVPVIYFAFSRKRCEFLADMARGLVKKSPDFKPVVDRFDRLCDGFGIEDTQRAADMRFLVQRGVAYHHAGLHPMLKEVVERLFSDRSIRLIFTTETFALGINMPARTVVIDDVRKRYGRFFRTLKNRDFSQMAGRSGRRGIDTEGFVYCRVNPHELLPNDLDSLFHRGPEPVRSRLNTSYATILNLYEIYGDGFLEIYQRSFHFYSQRRKSSRRLVHVMNARLALLKELGYIEDQRLTQRGHFARRMYGYEISLTELYASGLLEKLTVEQIAVVCLAVVFEPRPRSRRLPLPREYHRLRGEIQTLVDRVHGLERKMDIPDMSKRFNFDLTGPLLSWMREPSFNRLVSQSDRDEGEIIRYFRMTVQVLREIRDARLPGAFNQRLREATRRVNRGFVNAEEQLRLGLEADMAERDGDLNSKGAKALFPS